MEQMTIMLSKFENHDEDTFQAQKEVWTEYSKEFSDATGELNITGLIKSRKMGFTILE